MADQVTPGPCPTTGCPSPSQIDCIVVQKVYASCVQTLTATGTFKVFNCTSPITCMVDLDDSTCVVGAVSASSTDDINNITYVVNAVLELTCANNSMAQENIITTTTIPLYNPVGTTPSCTILSASCTCVVTQQGDDCLEIQCTVTLCVLAQTTATVQLLVPTYGFCDPGPCVVGPLLPCPPSPIFPPQQSSSS